MSLSPAVVAVRRRKKRSQTVLLVLLLPVFALVWLPLLQSRDGARKVATQLDAGTAGPGSAADATPPTPLAETTTPVPTAGSPVAIAELGRRIRALAAPYEPRWHGHADTTRPSPPGANDPATALPESIPAALVPSAILLAPGKAPVAIVQGAPVRVGDTVDGLSLVAIHEHDVQWRRGERTFVVPLSTPALGGNR